MDAGQSSMQHGQHEMSDMDMDTDMNMPCCDNKCDCPNGMCMNVAIVTTEPLSIKNSFKVIYNQTIVSFQVTQASSAIFHPPILS